jgi:hypothetical protein
MIGAAVSESWAEGKRRSGATLTPSRWDFGLEWRILACSSLDQNDHAGAVLMPPWHHGAGPCRCEWRPITSEAEAPPCRSGRVCYSPPADGAGIRRQIDGIGWRRAALCIDTQDPRDEARVPRAE